MLVFYELFGNTYAVNLKYVTQINQAGKEIYISKLDDEKAFFEESESRFHSHKIAEYETAEEATKKMEEFYRALSVNQKAFKF